MTDQPAVPRMRLELVPVPVSDVDRSRDFYQHTAGFHLDFDVSRDGMRVVQLTPPGSGCSIVIGTGLGEISEMQPGTIKALHLVVDNIREACDALKSRGLGLSEIVEYDRGIKYAHFSDPDGNSWALQEIPPGI